MKSKDWGIRERKEKDIKWRISNAQKERKTGIERKMIVDKGKGNEQW